MTERLRQTIHAQKTNTFRLIHLRVVLIFSLLIICPNASSQNSTKIHITNEQAMIIGHKIWQNEGLKKTEYLTVWNEGEDFPSLGIGHFIWYPPNTKATFIEQFPQFIQFLSNSGTEVPAWLAPPTQLPWVTREAFYANYDSKRMQDLRLFLAATIPLQVEFIIKRMEAALPKMHANRSTQEKRRIESRFYQVANQPLGPYALIDYINFKGEGTALTERYKNEGWGLLQVLENMNPNNRDTMSAFADAADFVLTRRVANAPRDESRWLKGWRKRLQTYRQP